MLPHPLKEPRTMLRRAHLCVAAVVASLAGMAQATDNQIALNYNWNGIVQPGHSSVPEAARGFRSIADRAMYVDGVSANCFGTGATVGVSGITYSINMTPNVLDIVHLGNTIVFTPTTATQGPPAAPRSAGPPRRQPDALVGRLGQPGAQHHARHPADVAVHAQPDQPGDHARRSAAAGQPLVHRRAVPGEQRRGQLRHGA